MSFVVRAEKRRAQTKQQSPGQDPPDLGWFLGGMVVGGVVMLVLEAVTIYYTWPVWVGFVKTVGLAEVAKEALK